MLAHPRLPIKCGSLGESFPVVRGVPGISPASYARSSLTRGITFVAQSSMFVINASCDSPPMPYFKSKRLAPNAVRLAAIFWARDLEQSAHVELAVCHSMSG